MKKGFSIFLGIFLGQILAAAQKIETLNGVRIVHNEKGGSWDVNPQVKPELVRKIGGLDAEENLSFFEPSDIVRDSAGNLYVLDSGNNRIQKLDPQGKFIKTIGRKGQGPGEFQSARSMDMDARDDLFVFDWGAKRVEVFSSDGKPLRTIKFRAFSAGKIRLLPMDLIVRGGSMNLGVMMGMVKKLPKLLELVEQNGKIRLAFGEAADYGDGITNGFANQFDLDTDSKKNVCLSFRFQNRIEKYSPDGTLLWQADRPLNYGTDVIEKGFVRRQRGRLGGGQVPKMNEVSRGIAVDGTGRIWVITLRRQLAKEELALGGFEVTTDVGVVSRKIPAQPKVVKADVYKLEIFSPDGVLLGDIPLSHHAHDIRIFGDNLFILENHNTVFYQYRILDKQ